MNTLVVIFQTTTMFKLLILLFIMNFFEILKVWPFNTLHENKNFRLTKICEKDRKDHIFISFLMFPFQGNIIFSELSFKRKCKKAASFRNARSCVNMKFSYTIAVRKDEIFYVVFYENKRFLTCAYVNFSLTIFMRKDEICYVVLQLK